MSTTHNQMTDDVEDVLDRTLGAVVDRDWEQLGELLINVRSDPGEHPPADELRSGFDHVELGLYSVVDVEKVTDCRVDATVDVVRTRSGSEHQDRIELTLFCVDGAGLPDPDGTWTVTNPVALQSMAES